MNQQILENIKVPICGPVDLKACSDGKFKVGFDNVFAISATGDRKAEFIHFKDHTLAYVKSAMGYPAYYPVEHVKIEAPIKAILMDLDGTSVRSESFWIWIIQLTIASLLSNRRFEIEEEDLPLVSGHSVSEHLQYCIQKYCPDKTVEEARELYFEHARFQMSEILNGKGKRNAFTPTPGLKCFLLELKSRGIKIGLVTSGVYEKAWPEVVSAFKAMQLGNPKEFYDTIITAGFSLNKGKAGTLGELSPKPHPWLYAEACRIGLGIPFDQRHHVIGIEDSAAGVISVRLAGFAVMGMTGGNIHESKSANMCLGAFENFEQVLATLNRIE